MNRIALVMVLALLACFAVMSPASAQDKDRVEVLAGVHYTLTAAEFEIDQDLGFGAGVGVRLGKRFILGAQYEVYTTTDDLKIGGNVDLSFYGLTGTWQLNDDTDFALLGVVGAGLGEITFENPLPTDPVLVDSTDLNLWYEAGFGVQFTGGDRWLYRFKLVGRRIDPDMPSVLLQSSKTLILPSFQVGVRF